MSKTDPVKNGGELYQLKTLGTLKTQRICDKVRELKSCNDVLFIVSFCFYVMLCGILTLYSIVVSNILILTWMYEMYH
jgi:hypothetical protein